MSGQPILHEKKTNVLQDVIRLFPIQYDHIDCCVLLADRAGRILAANPAFCRTTGYSAAELVGRRLSEMLHGPTTSAEERQRARDAMAAGRPFTIENVNYRKDRSPYWVRADVTPICDPQTGEVEGFLGITRNIQQRKAIEEKLREAEREQEAFQGLVLDILEFIPTSVAVYDQHRRLVFYNSAWLSSRPLAAPFLQKGMTLEDVLRVSIKAGQFAPALPADASPDQVDAFLQASIDHFNSHNQSRILTLGDGKSWEMRCFKTKAGYTITYGINISEQVIQIDFLQQIIDTVPSGVAVYDKDLRLAFVNKAWREQRPILSPHVNIGMKLSDILRIGIELEQYEPIVSSNSPSFEKEKYISDTIRFILHSEIASQENRERFFAGRWFRYYNLFTKEGFYVTVSQDLTDLKKSETLLREIVDALPIGALVVDPSERLVLANQTFRTLAPGLARRMRPGMSLAEMARIAIDEGDLAPEIPQNAPEDVKQQRVEFVLEQYRNPGRPRQRHLRDGRSVQIREQRSPSGYVVSAATDITELVSTMRDLAAARDEARAATEAKSRFLARMGHELRTPLNAIIGFSELLEGDLTLSEKQREQVQLIVESGRHLLQLINDLLDLSKIEAGKLEFLVRPFDLPALLASTADLMQAAAQRKRIELRRDLAADLPRQIRGDSTRLRQILLNLLSNAVKFTPAEGQVTLRAAAEPKTSADGKTLLRIEVEDSGPGISKDRLPQLFREFERGGPSLEPGTGLGLAISARLVEAMGGRIACDSEPGRGTLFRIEIPFLTVEEPATNVASATSERTASRTLTAGPPLRVLVVDDVAANRVLMRTLLTAEGHAVELAENGEKAIAAVASGTFDVVLMDVEMPGISGLEATRRIRALPPPHGQVPILALTAAAMPEQVAACREAGMDGHLAKPMQRAELLARLAEVASRRQRERSKSTPVEDGDTQAPMPMRQALSELEREMGETVASLLFNVAGEFRLGREVLARAAEEGTPSPSLRQTLERLAAGGRMVGADRLAGASDRLFAAIDAGQSWREALAETRAALDTALAELEAWFAARCSATIIPPAATSGSHPDCRATSGFANGDRCKTS